MKSLPRPISRIGLRPSTYFQRCTYATHPQTQTVDMAYQAHAPAHTEADPTDRPIIIMHGLFGSKQNNRGISKMLAKDLKRHIYALDLRNHGESPHVSQHTYTHMAGDVENFIKSKKLTDPILIGHSMGAKVAMSVALRSPDLVSSIVAVDNAPVNAQLGRQFANYVQAMKRIEDSNIEKQSDADAIIAEYESSLPVRQFLLTNLLRPVKGAEPGSGKDKFHWRIPVRTLGNALDEMASFPFTPGAEKQQFTKPSLFIRGTTSKYVADETIPLIGEFFPRFELKDVEAGHWVISENPEGFKQALLEFVNKDLD